MRAQALLLGLVLLLSIVSLPDHAEAALTPPGVGGYQPIRDVHDPYVLEIGRFAVAEHNKEAGQALVFVRVVSGQELVVDGANYRLVVEAVDGGASNRYEAVVYDRPWEKERQLTSFKPVP